MTECKYCNLDDENILFETKTTFVKIGSQHHHGHLSLVYKRHVEVISELTDEEFRDFCSEMKFISVVLSSTANSLWSTVVFVVLFENVLDVVAPVVTEPCKIVIPVVKSLNMFLCL